MVHVIEENGRVNNSKASLVGFFRTLGPRQWTNTFPCYIVTLFTSSSYKYWIPRAPMAQFYRTRINCMQRTSVRQGFFKAYCETVYDTHYVSWTYFNEPLAVSVSSWYESLKKSIKDKNELCWIYCYRNTRIPCPRHHSVRSISSYIM